MLSLLISTTRQAAAQAVGRQRRTGGRGGALFGGGDVVVGMMILRRGLAGHNKWSKIRHKKGAKDKARASLLGKASKAITAAALDCGGDTTNMRLQSAIQHAKSVQLPKDRIDDAIQKAISKGNNEDRMETVRYDAMIQVGGTKVGCVITALTDNRNRTGAQVRHMVTKYGNGELLPSDNLAYLFEHVGMITVENVKDEDELLECALDGGAINVEQDDDDDEENENSNSTTWFVTTEDTNLWQVVTALQQTSSSSFNVTQFEHMYILQDPEHGRVKLTDTENGEKELYMFLEQMDENEDVTNVYHNAE